MLRLILAIFLCLPLLAQADDSFTLIDHCSGDKQ